MDRLDALSAPFTEVCAESETAQDVGCCWGCVSRACCDHIRFRIAMLSIKHFKRQLGRGRKGPSGSPLGRVRTGKAMAKRDYLVEAAKQIRMALDREVSEDYEAAFSYYKNGVDLLLNGVQVDPNKERREAVKRKTTQYLKRAEEIFISHLQDNLGKGNPHQGGYSSLRFRPIRHLSSPVEDLEMCKVVGIIDKVLIVQSLVTKERCIVKCLPKSSWESRDHPTIIPQGVPYMVKLLRYYVSQDAVYLHLEHIQGGKLFSKLHKARNERANEYPECSSPSQHRIKLKNSYTSPTISSDYQQNNIGDTGTSYCLEREDDENPDSDSPESWHEAQHRLESCTTHSYCEETGCLQNNSRPAAPRRLDTHASSSGKTRTDIPAHNHHSQCLQSESQDKISLPGHLSTVHAPVVISEPYDEATANEEFKSSSDFDVAWKAAEPTGIWENSVPNAVIGTDIEIAAGKLVPHTTQTSIVGAASTTVNLKNHSVYLHKQKGYVPTSLQLPLQNQKQISEKATSTLNGFQRHTGSGSGVVTEKLEGNVHKEQVNDHCTEESLVNLERKKTEIPQPGRAGCPTTVKKLQLMRSSSGSPDQSPDPGCHRSEKQQGTQPGISLALTGVKFHLGPSDREPGEEVEEGWELLSPLNRNTPQGKGTVCEPRTPGPTPQCRKGDMEALLKAEGSYGQVEDQIIEVEGWCHLPQFPTKASIGRDRNRQGCSGLPEAEVRLLGAQILLALESLHQQGVVCRDLNPKNILLTSNGKVCLTFFGQWSEVQSEINSKAMEQMYCAPEIGGVSKITEACDWWSLGALLFELLTGMPLWQFHPAGVHSHTQLLIPDHLSTAAASLLTELLQFDAGYRLGSGGGGVSDIKCHPFFNGVSWKALLSCVKTDKHCPLVAKRNAGPRLEILPDAS
ncbi:hypothetical protein DPEC_G00311540 [Dallia pectoralis]|uniref:Uncharacterized protein n=1 Tax=Dallia pectoralis TaxID=75939 RepID=A0ACC2FBE0_DALPE|nr:hypothetical protein DPEC_G00311540 [Dallia pectoralis]